MHPYCNYTSTDSMPFGVWKVITNVSDRHGPQINLQDVLQIFEAVGVDKASHCRQKKKKKKKVQKLKDR